MASRPCSSIIVWLKPRAGQAAQTQRGWLMSMMHEYELLRMAMGGGAHEVLFTDIQPVDTKGTMQWPVATRICAIIEMSLFPAS